MSSKFTRILMAAGVAAGSIAYGRYRLDLQSIRVAIENGSTVAPTASGDIEYAEKGTGAPMLAVHGAGGGYDQGLLIASDFAEDYRAIAPSRFGYLKTPAPADFSPAAQADAHAALLDELDVRRTIVLAASAGAPSAIELALRHPDRVSALVLLVPRTYHPTESIGADGSAPSRAVLRLIESSADFLFWLALRISRASVVRFLGVPPAVEAAKPDHDRKRVTDIMASILPLSGRVRGIELDGLTQMSPWPLERIKAPTLIISAEDDLYRTLPGARFTAERIHGAELHVLSSGGHLMVGQTATVAKLVRDFLSWHQSARSQPETLDESELQLPRTRNVAVLSRA